MEHKKTGKAFSLKSGGGQKKFGNKRKKQLKKKLGKRKEMRKLQRKEKKAKKHEYILSKTHAIPPNQPSKKKPIPKKKNAPVLGKKPRQSRTLTIKTVADKIKEEQKALEEAKIARLEQKYFGGRYSSSEEESSDEDSQQKNESDDEGWSSSSVSDSESWDKKLTMDQLKEKMEKTRRKRLLEENEAEDKYIESLAKKLKLNKKAIVPQSFRTDGLDCKCY